MKKSILWFLLPAFIVVAGSILYGCTEKEEDLKGTIYGTVTDLQNNEPIGGVNVKLTPTGEATLTGSDGSFEFKDLDANNYTLSFSKAEYADLDDDFIIELEAGKKVKRDVQMRRKIASLKITDMQGNDLDTLDFGEDESVVVKTFNIFNDGTEVLQCQANYECDWITSVSGLESAIQPTKTVPVTVRIDRVALDDGVNTTFLYITSGNGSNEIVVKATFRGTVSITTTEATSVTASSATIGGNITDDGGRPVLVRGICYGTSQSPDLNDDHTEDGSGSGTFSHNITGLSSSTTYYARAYATNRNGTYYSSNIISFTTANGLPTVTTTDVTDITASTAKSGGNVTNNGGFEVTARGVCWNTMGSPDLNDLHTTNGNGNGAFTSNITDLQLGTTYYVRAYATNSKGTTYGAEKTFTTPSGSVTINFSQPTNVTASSATCTAEITDDGGAPIAFRGFCWSTSQYPTSDGNHVELGMGSGSFYSTITSLQPSTTYYIRAYAVNAAGTHYSTQQTITTTSGLPVLTTATVSNITATTAQSGGNITSDGGFSVTARGVCWNTMGNPDLNGSHTTNGTGIGSFTANLTNLTPGTTYHVRAYATNSTGTVYGNEQTFTTNDGLPHVTTGTVSNITATSAVCSGNVISDGGVAVTAKGFCWSTAQYPSISGSHSNEGSGVGSFNGSLTNLNIATTYYVRAYATNSTGTVYGDQISFTTGSGLPTVTTTTPTLNGNTATSGGNVISDGGFPVTARGICYGSILDPDLTSTYNHTSNGSGTGHFSSQFNIQNGDGVIYIRAYATNSNGTVYGQQESIVLAYDTLPTFTYNGHTYKVAPDPGYTFLYWTDANSYCEGLSYAGFSDWRLPTKEELQVMCANKQNIGGFASNWVYWSGSLIVGNEDGRHWVVNFNNCQAGNGPGGYYLRPIRVDN